MAPALLLSVEEDLKFWRELVPDMDFTYVIQAKPEFPIKIGHGTPEERLRAAQTGNWEDLQLLYVMPGGEELEREFHYRLRQSRVRGEWFGDPGKTEFLDWIPSYVAGVKRYAEVERELPPPPITYKGDPTYAPERQGANIVHRWRMSQPRETAVTLRWVEPEPMPPDERQRREEIRAFGYARTSNGSNPIPDTQGTEARPSAG